MNSPPGDPGRQAAEQLLSTGIKTLAIDSIAVLRQENAGSRFRIVKQWRLRRDT
jgi:hypothetical protein